MTTETTETTETTTTETTDAAVGAKVTLYFTIDELLGPAVEQALLHRGWKRAAIHALRTQIHETALLGFHVDLERTE